MKIGYRISLLYFGANIFTLILFSLLSYYGMKKLLYRTLYDEMEVVVHMVEEKYNPTNHTFDDLTNIGLDIDQKFKYAYIVVHNVSAFPVYSSLLAHKINLNLQLSRHKERVDYVVHLPRKKIPFSFINNQNNGQITFMGFSQKIYVNNKHIGWVTVALPVEDIESALSRLLRILIGVSLIFTLIIAFWSYLLTTRVLQPVRQITATAREISFKNINQRISIKNKKDELAKLVDVLNDMFSRLEDSISNQQQFLTDAAHELKTPLAVLRISWEEQFENDQVPVSTKEKLLQDIEVINRLSQVVNKLLLLSQTETDTKEIQARFSVLEISDIVREVTAECEILVIEKAQQIHIEDTSEKAGISGDPSLLTQLFFNLIENAIKYTPENGEIRINIEKKESTVLVSIRDNGIGIPPDDLPLIFNRFYRVQKDRSRKTGGSGLGLSICKLIAELHYGKITVESTPGKGSHFMVHLPVCHP